MTAKSPAPFQLNPHDAAAFFYKNAVKSTKNEGEDINPYQQLHDDARLSIGEAPAFSLCGEHHNSEKAAYYAAELERGIRESIKTTPDLDDHLAALGHLASHLPRYDSPTFDADEKGHYAAMAALVYLRLIAATGRHGSPADVLWLQWRGVGRPQNPMEKSIREAAQLARNTRAYRAQLAQERANAANAPTDTQNS